MYARVAIARTFSEYSEVMQPDVFAWLRNRTAEICSYASGHPVIQPVDPLRNRRPVTQPDKLRIRAEHIYRNHIP